MAETNINYLLSAMVQSGAALVAIVGGLLGARYVSLHAEIESTRSQLTGADIDALNTKSRFDDLDRHIDEVLARIFFCREGGWRRVLDDSDDLLDLIGEARGAAHRIARDSAAKSVAERSRLYLTNARRELAPLVERLPRRAPAWLDFRRDHGIYNHDEDDFMFELAYIELVDKRPTKSRGPHAVGYLDLALPLAIEGEERKLRETLADARARFERVEEELARLTVQRSLLRARLAGLRQGEGFWLAIEVLAAIAITTIVVPLVFMVTDVYDYVPASRWTFVAVFIGGLALLGWYLAIYSRYLADKRESMPGHVWGLFRRDPRKTPGSSESAHGDS